MAIRENYRFFTGEHCACLRVAASWWIEHGSCCGSGTQGYTYPWIDSVNALGIGWIDPFRLCFGYLRGWNMHIVETLFELHQFDSSLVSKIRSLDGIIQIDSQQLKIWREFRIGGEVEHMTPVRNECLTTTWLVKQGRFNKSARMASSRSHLFTATRLIAGYCRVRLLYLVSGQAWVI